jgi:hypothetical protein
MRPIAPIGLAALLSLSPGAAGGQALGSVLMPTGTLRPCVPTEGAYRAFVQGPRLQAAYQLLLDRSPSFAEALAAIESTNGMRIRVGYRRHLLRGSERLMGEERAGAVFLADGALFHPPGTILCGVRVVFFTEELEEGLLAAGVPEAALVEDLAVMIAHEVFGHLIPFAEQKLPVWPTPCRDPEGRAARWTTGCAVDRENLIRQELGVTERSTYARPDGPLACELAGRRCRLPRPGRLAASHPPLPFSLDVAATVTPLRPLPGPWYAAPPGRAASRNEPSPAPEP